MAHSGLLRDYRFNKDVDDIRETPLYDANDDKVGQIEDVIFDHSNGSIQYAVVDAGGWLSTKKFLVPANRIDVSPKHDNAFSTSMTKDEIKSLPEYDEKHLANDEDWGKYQRHYRESLETTGGVLHKEGSTHTITPGPDELPATGSALPNESALEPDRMAGKFPEAAPDSSKTRLRPSGIAARAEDSATPGVSVAEEIPTRVEEDALDRRPPQSASTTGRFGAFEDHLRRNRVNITACCGSCAAAKDRVA